VRVAALYDVHAMPWALEAVLAELDADAIVFGGDFVYGPFPRETVAAVRSLEAVVIRGNCERDASTDDWDSSRLSADDLAWIASLPLTAAGRS
jgi:predicted phosphodiesterase